MVSINKFLRGDPVVLRRILGTDALAVFVRIFGWSTLTALVVFLLNNVLTVWFGWPGAFHFDNNSAGTLSWLQSALYAAALFCATVFVLKHRKRSLRTESEQISRICAFVIRAAFWATLVVGLVDMSLSALRATELLDNFVGNALAGDLANARFRGLFVHMPLIALSIVVAAFTRALGFAWLGLLIVVVELEIVMFRFIFSYEQAFMGDLVRFWYSALFLFACANTLHEEGHVRVDVLYANFSSKTKGLVNAFGTILFGIPLCWVILTIGMAQKTSIINGALLGFETTGIGYGMFVKYLMSVFLGIFAISMLIQFVSYLFGAVADYRGEQDGHGHSRYAAP